MNQLIDRFEAMLAAGQDTAVLRFSLGNAYLDDDPAQAATHLKRSNSIHAIQQLGKFLARL